MEIIKMTEATATLPKSTEYKKIEYREVISAAIAASSGYCVFENPEIRDVAIDIIMYTFPGISPRAVLRAIYAGAAGNYARLQWVPRGNPNVATVIAWIRATAMVDVAAENSAISIKNKYYSGEPLEYEDYIILDNYIKKRHGN